MPELPEVETTKNDLKLIFLKNCVEKILINIDSLRIPIQKKKIKKLEGNKIIKVSRRGKFILVTFNNNKILLFHLGMSGRFVLKKKPFVFCKHDHFVLIMKKKFCVILNDPRRFGLVEITSKKELCVSKHLKHLGIEPLSKKFTYDYLNKILFKKKKNIKSFLLDQKYIAGLGNIYACESLYMSKISPFRMSMSLKKKEISSLCLNIKKVLKVAISHEGSSINDFKSPLGAMGKFQNKFKVYDREGKICKNKFCKSVIVKKMLSNRSTYYCRNCQKM